jgi:hypothetical protein
MAYITEVGTSTLSGHILPGGVTTNITESTARPYTLSQMDVAAGLSYDLLNRKLQIESTLDSVFEDVGTDVVFTGRKMALPDACVLRISGGKTEGARTQIMPMIHPLVGQAEFGTDSVQEGKERQTTMSYMKIYYNEYSYGVAYEHWGMNYNELQALGYYNELQPAMSKWYKEDADRQYHEALLEGCGYVLTGAGTNLEKNYNKNFYIPNTEWGDQPTFNTNATAYRTSIDAALEAAATGSYGVNANIDLDYFGALELYASQIKRITPVTIGGKPSYVMLLPSSQYLVLKRLSDGKLGDFWAKTYNQSSEEMNLPGYIGRIGSIVVIEDMRYPTIRCNYSTHEHNVEYVNPGNQDARNKTVYAASNTSWDVGFLMGAGAIVDWTVTPQHFETAADGYKKKSGKAVFCERGIQTAYWDTDTAANNNKKNFSSITLLFSAPSLVVRS